MLGKLRLRPRRANLERTLAEDICQPAGYIEWLGGARSIRELHQTCAEPGWLVYCGYWDGISQDRCLDALIKAARFASENIPRCPIPARLLDSLADKDWPDLVDIMLDLERRHPLIAALVDALPTQLNYTLGAANAPRLLFRDVELADMREQQAEHGPYRSATELGVTESDALLAAAFVLVIEALFHRHEGLREALTVRAAAASSLLAAAAPDDKSELVAIVRETYGWR